MENQWKRFFANRLTVSINFSPLGSRQFHLHGFFHPKSNLRKKFTSALKIFSWLESCDKNTISFEFFLDKNPFPRSNSSNDYIRFIYLSICFFPSSCDERIRNPRRHGTGFPLSRKSRDCLVGTSHLSLSLSLSPSRRREIRKRDFPWPWPMIFSSCTRTDCLTPII